MRRPVPVLLTSVFLGLIAAFTLLAAIGLVAVGFISLHKSLPTAAAPLPYSSSGIAALFFGTAVLALASASWMIGTLVGLLRMRSWARYSALVIAGLMTGFGAILTISSFAMPFLLPAMRTQPGVDLSHVGAVFLISGLIYGTATAIGIALLVYFNLAGTRALFLSGAPVSIGPPNTSTGRPRPTTITVISWLYMVSGTMCSLYILFPFPAFLFGFVLRGLAARITYLALGLLTFAIGYGLLRLRNEARLAVYGLFISCPIQIAVLLTPWGMRQFRVYIDAYGASMNGGMYAVNPFLSPGPMVFFSAVGLAGYGVILWLLHRHRTAFTQAPPAPPMPVSHQPLPTI